MRHPVHPSNTEKNLIQVFFCSEHYFFSVWQRVWFTNPASCVNTGTLTSSRLFCVPMQDALWAEMQVPMVSHSIVQETNTEKRQAACRLWYTLLSLCRCKVDLSSFCRQVKAWRPTRPHLLTNPHWRILNAESQLCKCIFSGMHKKVEKERPL